MTVFAVQSEPTKVTVNGMQITSFSFNSDTSVLEMGSLNLDMARSFTIEWS